MTSTQTRRYDGRARARSSDETRQRVLDVSMRSFLDSGYRATTMKHIAGEAAVHLDTVYELVGRKPDIVRTLVEHALSGTERVVPAEDRDYVTAIRNEPDPSIKIDIYAKATGAMLERVAPLFVVLRDAAAADTATGELWQSFSDRRAENMRAFVADVLDATGAPSDQRVIDDAADTVWITNSPATYIALTHERRWSAEHYERWLADLWKRVLIRDAPDDRSRWG